ncbi:MAG: hypothetical protein UY40_C0007G0017 [candidate division CPR1 bacterium GW2011_GWC1_49_13]|uniref:Uncharacterized protein n=1 Tax=candidate division CPR1 bacterium GW2011_GWC1_49_13 TaxID=1618342 RepID=A0A0G1VH48_9BACT|nr:MAG: hypothetical protein UY40_C0007G0017 [candidate division CPR1 bacterium GW2011_GWC1_49_13]
MGQNIWVVIPALVWIVGIFVSFPAWWNGVKNHGPLGILWIWILALGWPIFFPVGYLYHWLIETWRNLTSPG